MSLRDKLFHEILMARKRVYAVAQPTPLERASLPVDAEVYVKREDLSPIHAYKWRGAYNRMAMLHEEERGRGVVCASAGNHAQGVALAASRLGVDAKIFMPISTPRTKLQAVARLGGPQVAIEMLGDTFDVASAAAAECAQREQRVYVHPYDDLAVMAGQGTLADEIVMSGMGPFDVVYLQIGGGGMAAAVACWLKGHYPDIRCVGVEGIAQASMAAAVAAGGPVALEDIDIFCDGTAVRRAGTLTYPLCAELVDAFITVTNEEVCAAIEAMWNASRVVLEPSGAMGVAGLLKQRDLLRGKRVLAILCGANVDFDRLTWIAHHAGIGAKRRRYYRFEMRESPGGLLHLLDAVPPGINIIEVQYGKVDEVRAWPVIGFEASEGELEILEKHLRDQGIPFELVTSQEDVEFCIIHYEPELFHLPYFIRFNFPERPGALRDFLLDTARGETNICYFNYSFSGEQIGRALIGFEFTDERRRQDFQTRLTAAGFSYRELEEAVLSRIL